VPLGAPAARGRGRRSPARPKAMRAKILGYQRRSESQLLDTYSCYILLNTIEFCSLLGVLVPSAGALGEKPDALATVNFRE
jgi:hypothetical protein